MRLIDLKRAGWFGRCCFSCKQNTDYAADPLLTMVREMELPDSNRGGRLLKRVRERRLVADSRMRISA